MSLERLETGIIVTPTNDVVRRLNNVILERLDGRPVTYLSTTRLRLQDSASSGDGDLGEFIITQEELDNVNVPNLPPHELRLKINSVVMLLCNLNKRLGLCNGTRFIVTGMFKESIRVKRITPFRGRRDEIFLSKLFMRSEDVAVAGSVERFQIPVTPAFVITINKSQGQSVQRVGLFLRRPVFSGGQFYVAVSRGMNGRNVFIAVVKGPEQGPIVGLRGGRGAANNVKTKNIVYRSLL
jgi:hypothetical protein